MALLAGGCSDSPTAPSLAQPGPPAGTVPESAGHTLSGQVLCDNKQPIWLATVWVTTSDGKQHLVFTDLDGRYAVSPVAGSVRVSITAGGFVGEVQTLSVDEDLTLNFELERLP
jgi:Carboxypeptidase regulatory-like domain